MTVVIITVFSAAFAIVLLLSMSFDSSGVQSRKQTRDRLAAIAPAAAREHEHEDEGASLLRDELPGSSIGWIDEWLKSINLFGEMRKLLVQAEMKWTVGGVLVMSFASWLVVALAIFFRTNTIWLSVLLGAVGAAGPLSYVRYKRSARFGKFEQMLPLALDMMVSALRAGHSFVSAIETVAKEMADPIGGEFRKCFDEQNFGLEMRESMLNLAARVPIHDIHIIVSAVLIQRESGGNLAEILEKVAYIIRERFRLKRQVRVYTAQGRLTGWILSLLPVVLGTALYLVNPEHMSILWENPVGLKLIYTAAVMTVIGGLIIRKIVNIRI